MAEDMERALMKMIQRWEGNNISLSPLDELQLAQDIIAFFKQREAEIAPKIEVVTDRVKTIIDMATLEERTEHEKADIVNSIMNIMVLPLIKASAFDEMGARLDRLHEYLSGKEDDHYSVRDHGTALRYNHEKNMVENVQLIYKELRKAWNG